MAKNGKEVLKAWKKAITSGKLGAITDLYEDDATLIPTFSSKTRYTVRQRKAYFRKLLASRVKLVVENRSVREKKRKGSMSIVTGRYRWLRKVEGTEISFPSLFTMVVDLEAEQPIVHHHSSQMPRDLA